MSGNLSTHGDREDLHVCVCAHLWLASHESVSLSSSPPFAQSLNLEGNLHHITTDDKHIAKSDTIYTTTQKPLESGEHYTNDTGCKGLYPIHHIFINDAHI